MAHEEAAGDLPRRPSFRLHIRDTSRRYPLYGRVTDPTQ